MRRGNTRSAKPKVVPAVFVLLLILTIGAQAREKTALGLRFQIGTEASFSDSKYRLIPYPGWEANFELPRFFFYGVPRTDFFAPVKEVRNFIVGDVFVGVTPTLRLGSVEVGIPVNLYLSNFLTLPVTKSKVDLEDFEEDDILTVSEIRLKKTTPAAGLSLRFGRESGIEVQLLTYGFAFTEYHCIESAYEAESRHNTGIGGLFYEVEYYTEYTSESFEQFRIREGQAFHLSVGLWEEGARISGFVEKAGRYLRGGLTVAVDL